MPTTLPESFLQQLQMLVKDEADAFKQAIDEPVVSTVRVNPLKPTQQFDQAEKVAWCEGAYYLKERPEFIADPLLHAGTYYVQESSSMFLQQVLQQLQNHLPAQPKVLDLCAAPGGKSTLISGWLGKKGLLVSNEIIQARVRILSENITRWGLSNVLVTHNDPKDFRKTPAYFDVIVVDAPCSGEGMFRKDKKAIDEWSPEHVELCTARQQRILADVMDALKPGGFLIYSTCTFNTSENEENVTWMIKEFGLQQFPITIAPNWGITPSAFLENAYRFYPHKVKGEGLFMCCLQKPGADEENIRSEKFSPLSRAVQNELYQWIQPETPMEFVQEGNMYIGLSLNIVPDYLYLKRKLKLAQSGIKMGEIMKGQLIPDHALALSVDLCSQVKRQELNLEDAKRFLRKDVIAATSFQETGWALVTYQNHGLGWVKVLPNRVNNYFPTNWRVIKEI